MYIRPCYKTKDGKRHAYWTLVESVRTERGPRQRVVAYLGDMDESGCLGMQEAAQGEETSRQQYLLKETVEPEWVEVDVSQVRVENTRDFGGPWLGLALIKKLGLDSFLQEVMPSGREDIPWWAMAVVSIICRLCNPSSELHIAEHYYEKTALPELMGITKEKVYDQRLYRTLDALLPQKEALEIFLKKRLGELFSLDYDLLLYDVTSTYFEGKALDNPKAKQGYSRDHRPDCKQVCIGLVVSRCGMPFGYEVFDGNRSDVTTTEEVVECMEARYGKANRIWVMDRGLVSDEVITFLNEEGRRYIVGTPRSRLRTFEKELVKNDWTTVREGVEVKLCSCPEGGQETYILCRSADRRQKEKAMHQRFEERIEVGLKAIETACHKRKQKVVTIAKRLGRLLSINSRAAKLFKTDVIETPQGAQLVWSKEETARDWAALSEGCYLLRTNVGDWTDEELWKAYIQLTEIEEAFRIHKSDLHIRPIWHQREDRVLAHILVCFLAYVLWKTLEKLAFQAGLGNEPRKILHTLSQIQLVDVVLPTRKGVDIRKQCITQPTEHQKILLQHLKLELPARLISPKL